MKAAQNTLSIEAADEIILAACRTEDGAIEDCEVSEETVSYFFETGAVGTVSRITGAAKVKHAK
jgi:hypothetical protein